MHQPPQGPLHPPPVINDPHLNPKLPPPSQPPPTKPPPGFVIDPATGHMTPVWDTPAVPVPQTKPIWTYTDQAGRTTDQFGRPKDWYNDTVIPGAGSQGLWFLPDGSIRGANWMPTDAEKAKYGLNKPTAPSTRPREITYGDDSDEEDMQVEDYIQEHMDMLDEIDRILDEDLEEDADVQMEIDRYNEARKRHREEMRQKWVRANRPRTILEPPKRKREGIEGIQSLNIQPISKRPRPLETILALADEGIQHLSSDQAAPNDQFALELKSRMPNLRGGSLPKTAPLTLSETVFGRNVGPGNYISGFEEAYAAGPVSLAAWRHDLAYDQALLKSTPLEVDEALQQADEQFRIDLLNVPESQRDYLWSVMDTVIGSGIGKVYGNLYKVYRDAKASLGQRLNRLLD